MNPRPLDQISFGWHDHKSALWWLGMIYARPDKFAEALKKSVYTASYGISVRLLLHAFPYVIVLNALSQYVIFDLLDFPLKTLSLLPYRFALYVYPIFHGILLGTLTAMLGMLTWHRGELSKSLNVVSRVTFGITFGIVGGVVFGIKPSPSAEIVFGIALGCAVGVITGVISGLFGNSTSKLYYGGLTGTTLGISVMALSGFKFGGAHLMLLGCITGLSAAFFAMRLYYYPFHCLFVWPKPRDHWYPYHPVVWNSQCSAPFVKLHTLLVSLFH
ncbi:MAG: hypothetical protein ACREEM_21070 [Blastocatellia bacterium]